MSAEQLKRSVPPAPELVTIYLPTHNRLQSLKRALASVYAQTYPNIELIVVDDGSSDGTAEYLGVEQAAGRLRVFHHASPQGACAARNTAINAANGSLISGLDDDDEFTPERVECLVAAFNQMHAAKQPIAGVASGLIEVDHQGRERVRRGYSGMISLERLLHGNAIGNQMLTRTQWLRDIGGFDPQLPALQDYDTWVRLVHAYGPAYKLPQRLYRWHNGQGAQITFNSTARVQAFVRFMYKHGELLNAKQRRSMQVLQAKLEGTRLTFSDVLRLVNRYNARALTALVLAQRAQPLLNLYRRSRCKS